MQSPVLTAETPSATLIGVPGMRAAGALPLCVDLDGTLVKSDTLVDSVFALARQHPSAMLRLPGWLARGKAGFKAAVAQHVTLDVAHLPYNRPLLAWLQEQRAAGRAIYLSTGADESTATRVAAHLSIFDGVFASKGVHNLTGKNKLQQLQSVFPGGFAYVGNAAPDVPVLQAAGEGFIANPTRGLRSRLGRDRIPVVKSYVDRAPLPRTLRKAIRVQQWAKNVLLFLPLLLAHTALDRASVIALLLAFLAISLAASSTYILNDLLDIEADRRHPRKRLRPFASGDLSAIAGLGIAAVFVMAAVTITAVALPAAFGFWLAAYYVTTIAYSFWLKRIALVDVVVLAGLYTVRLLAGGAAAQVDISPWLAGFSLFFFLSLAFVKRYAELHNLRARDAVPANGRGYMLADIDQLRAFGTSAGYASVVVFALYINAPIVQELYRHPVRLWLLAPVLIFWLSRVWLLAGRGELDEDPVIFAITDRVSLMLGLLVALFAWSAI